MRIVALEPGAPPVVRYTVHIETDAREPLAKSLLDRYALTAKTTYPVWRLTGRRRRRLAGPVPTLNSMCIMKWLSQLVTASTSTPGWGTSKRKTSAEPRVSSLRAATYERGASGSSGCATYRRSTTTAKLSTEGGHIQVQDIVGNMDAFTAGGHIVAGNISGDAVLRSGGGHIRAGQIGGRAQLETDGGNITLKQAGSFVSVRTGGGQIDFGEVRGSVRAQTGGGGIRIITVSGPMEVESNGGSICLTRVAGAVQAATAGGTIQAWINPDAASSAGKVSLPGASQLSSGAGDIIVFLPRNLAANIDALVENGGVNRIDADPALLLNIQQIGNRSSGPVRAMGVLNGGGEVLKLRTTVGKIRLQFLDADTGLRDSLIREQRERINRWHESDFLPVKSVEPGPSEPRSLSPSKKKVIGLRAGWTNSR